MRLEGSTLVCERHECPLCMGMGFRPTPGGPSTALPAVCSHQVPSTREYADVLAYTLHFVERPALLH